MNIVEEIRRDMVKDLKKQITNLERFLVNLKISLEDLEGRKWIKKN